ncbi:MAG: ankyrin repeat domain-containing protein [Alphaproteobacteria bacterium]|nr:ankyrin repeat domain-containing protein [Alphaproteobacteria bacterium]
MKFVSFLTLPLFFVPFASFGASNEFMLAAQLLSAAKSADVQQVQMLVGRGANINYIDSTGLSIVCTALLNNDVRAAQILQMYGADASKCDRQIKNYNSRNGSASDSGLFSGLSSAQNISLAVGGAVAVVGGLLLLTDVFDPGNDNDVSGDSGNRPNNNPGTDSGGGAMLAYSLPYGPAMPDAADEALYYTDNLDKFSPGDDSIYATNFELMTDSYQGQNYLLMMHGYSPLARGYLGMQTLRNSSTKVPFDLGGIEWVGDMPVMGGRPVNVALVTGNGINSAGFAYGVDAENSLSDTLLPWTNVNGSTVNNADNSMVSSKYYNNLVVLGEDSVTTLSGASTVEDADGLSRFDLAGYGTAVNNAYASYDDDLLAKVVGGRDAGYANADFFGFMPNGQMTIFRTGDGMAFLETSNTGGGDYFRGSDGELDEIVLFGKTLSVTPGEGNAFTASYTETVTGDNGELENVTTTYSGYIGTNGYLYIDSDADGVINQAYSMLAGSLELEYELGQADYYNYKALRNAVDLMNVANSGRRSAPGVLANAAVIEPLRASNAKTIEDVLSWSTVEAQQTGISNFVNLYYDEVDNDYYPGSDAGYVFGNLGTSFKPLVVFSTGAFETDSDWSGKTLSATFENAVPLVYENTEHYFMSVVGVRLTGSGTVGTETVSGYSPSSKIALTTWADADANKFYKARACGVAGTGQDGVDPWCFAAAGITDELAVASAAGAAGVLKSAFPEFDNTKIFTLMALTADGPYLGTQPNGSAFTEDTLAAYLQGMYELPNEYRYSDNAGYLEDFKEVFGYGLINLERATKPGTSIYYYDGADIVSASGNAYWRAATNTVFKPSAVLNLHGVTISAPFYDVLTNIDGTMSLPRVWENKFAFGSTDERGLYMGDVLGELKTRNDDVQRSWVGALGVTLGLAERAYDDNMGGLDNLSLDYKAGNWQFGASYQHYLTDGVSRFSGLANPVLGLMSNAVVSDAKYNFGNWTFGARAFSGAITSEGLLENDPTISAQYVPARLGLMQGAQSHVAWSGEKFAFTGAVGNSYETNTLLGAQTDGLLDFGNGNTVYVDALAQYKVSDDVGVSARATFAHTISDVGGEFVLGLTDIKSNALAFGANVGNFEFSVSQPLAITDGALQYAHAEYDVVEIDGGKYELNIVDTSVRDLMLAPEKREVRFMGTYRHSLGQFTDGAIGFIYRVNPNHTNEFGNESIFMLKMTHRLGI